MATHESCTVNIGGRPVGDGEPCFIVAEIGINHNGDDDTLMRLIDVAADAGCNAVKFQKRTVDLVYTPEELARPRESVFGETNGDLKYGLELSIEQYERIDKRLHGTDLQWFVSCWDTESISDMEMFCPPCYKVASASVTDLPLLAATRATGRPVILSSGMSNLAELTTAVQILGREQLILCQCTSTYPAKNSELGLRCIQTLRDLYDVPVGYSGHEIGLATTIAAVAMGACMIERHITLDRSMWGSDQAASIEPQALRQLVRDIRAVESAMGDGVKRVWDSEVPIRQKLRRVCVEKG